jgi:hypothetical protein
LGFLLWKLTILGGQTWGTWPGLDLQTWEISEAEIEENKNPLVEVHRLPSPQKRGTGATFSVVE